MKGIRNISKPEELAYQRKVGDVVTCIVCGFDVRMTQRDVDNSESAGSSDEEMVRGMADGADTLEVIVCGACTLISSRVAALNLSGLTGEKRILDNVAAGTQDANKYIREIESQRVKA